MAAAERQAGDAGLPDQPAGGRQTKGLRLVIEVPQVTPPSARAVWRAASTRTPLMRERSIIRPPSLIEKPGKL